MQDPRGHQFGGDWTSKKLKVLQKYLTEYVKALKKQPFKKAYIDAFAGTGYRRGKPEGTGSDSELFGFDEVADDEPQELLDGSARLALGIEPPFDKYIFIEKRQDRCDALGGLITEFPDLKDRIDIRKGDANLLIRELCYSSWNLPGKARRAVLFLDPYGMQVEWKTIQAIASTEAIDLWILFPLGQAVNRLLKKSGDIPESWRRRLTILFGTEDWYPEFYKREEVLTLFGAEEETIKLPMETIGRFFVDRLKTVFPDGGVSENPAVLRNSTNCPLFLLCFASANPKGARVALPIANHLLQDIS